jgi:hypothetical protein
MSALYEVQVLKGQVWRVDSVFDDKELAVEAAKRMGESGRETAVRVIEDQTDPKTGRAVLRAVFRISRASPTSKLEVETLDQPTPAIKDVEQRVQTYVSDKRRRERSSGLLAVVLRLLMGAALIGAGFLAIYFVHDYLNKVMP